MVKAVASVEPDAPSLVLDEVDYALIELLRQDGRTTFAEMGNDVNLSGEAIRNRIARLERGGVVKVVGSVSPHVLGYEVFAFIGISVSGSAKAVGDRLAAFPTTDFVVSTAGEFDVVAEVVCRDEDELLEALDAIREVPGVQGCQTFLYLSFEKYGYDPVGLGGIPRPGFRTRHDPPTLDEADLAIIQALREDGRVSYTDLAAMVGMTYPSARRRLLRLRDSGVLHISTIVNRIVSQRQVQAGIGVTVSGDVREVAKNLEVFPEIGMMITTSGKYDLMLEVTCRDRADFADFVGTRLRSAEGVVSTQTFVYLHIHKLAYTWSALAS